MFKNDNQKVFLRLLWCLIVVRLCITYSMDKAIIYSADDVTWKFFFTHNRDVLDGDDEHSFAQTNRANCALIYAIQDQRKKAVQNYMVANNIVLSDKAQCVYHRSWRMFGSIDIVSKEEDKILSGSSALRMFSCVLHGNQLPDCKVVVWDNFTAKLPHNPFPFFNKNKELCFHGFQKDVYIDPYIVGHSVRWQAFVEYTINERFICKLHISDVLRNESFIELLAFLNYPILLKNILDCDEFTIDSTYYSPRTKLYNLNKIKLAENYKHFQQCCWHDYPLALSGRLSQNIRNILARHYKEQ